MSKAPQIKNRAPAPIQITAEQLLRESQERGLEDVAAAPKQFITDKEELVQYQQTKRKDFEDQLRRQRQNIGIWCRYALWEASVLDFTRARSVFERALDVDYRNQTLWLKYAEMEMKNKFINHARNVWDRAVTLLPRIDNFWYKYTYMEEMVGAIDNARQIFERWMAWEPDDMAWAAFIKFEMRQGMIDSARALYERYIALWPTARAYLKYARWEEAQHQRGLARKIYERSLAELHPQEKTEKLLTNFARFEERCKEFDRARTIYQYAIQQKQQQQGNAEQESDDLKELKQEFILFEKRHGNKQGIEDVIVQQRREHFETKLAEDGYNYDIWMDYIHLEEAEGSVSTVRQVYKRAVTMKPPLLEKKYWKRYIYLWINFAVYEELTAKDVVATRRVYQDALQVVPHKIFTFGKLWLYAAHFEVRQHQLTSARKLLGQAIGLCGKDNLFQGYIELELQLGEIERCRTLYGKYIAFAPHNAVAWQKFASLEGTVGETARARAIYELGINQPELDMPEMLWKSYLDFEVAEREFDHARALYERLLDRTGHVKVWISFGKFEYEQSLLGSESDDSANKVNVDEHVVRARDIFTRGYVVHFPNCVDFSFHIFFAFSRYDALRREGLKEERILLLEAWREMEQDALRKGQGTREDLAVVEAKFPRKVKRVVSAEEAFDVGATEEFYDYIFPDDEKKPVGMKLLEQAMAWKQKLAAAAELAAASAGAEVPSSSSLEESSSVLGKRKGPFDDNNEVDIDA